MNLREKLQGIGGTYSKSYRLKVKVRKVGFFEKCRLFLKTANFGPRTKNSGLRTERFSPNSVERSKPDAKMLLFDCSLFGSEVKSKSFLTIFLLTPVF